MIQIPYIPYVHFKLYTLKKITKNLDPRILSNSIPAQSFLEERVHGRQRGAFGVEGYQMRLDLTFKPKRPSRDTSY